ncbi:hypothetical protein EDB81DRAFT_660871 [Dactylonectria macrodidyma]|uniref:Uncharacterized protein n=1 Tax=Dactylonectria macrodidyma TaxID=307937 RepID=A0A9P9E221_9HYPO|nr:hypothetical protein EDB81DRAFT_660871 [Dactylonectria macrodidyma]
MQIEDRANTDYPGPAIALWFKGFFKPGLVGVTTLGALTFGGGLRAFWFYYHGTAQKQVRSSTVSRWSLAGLISTLFHFGFSNKANWHCSCQVLSIMNQILSEPELAQPQMAKWMRMHVTRTLIADVPAWMCFIVVLLYEI